MITNIGSTVYTALLNQGQNNPSFTITLINSAGSTDTVYFESSGSYRISAVATARGNQLPDGGKATVMRVGSGTAEPEVDDYALGSQFADNVLAPTGMAYSTTGSGSPIYTGNFTNMSNETQTITELGIYLADRFQSNYTDFYLFVHELLNEPIEVQPNETVVLAYELAFN